MVTCQTLIIGRTGMTITFLDRARIGLLDAKTFFEIGDKKFLNPKRDIRVGHFERSLWPYLLTDQTETRGLSL